MYLIYVHRYLSKAFAILCRDYRYEWQTVTNFPGFFKTGSHHLSLFWQITLIVPEQISGLHHRSITSGHHECNALLFLQMYKFVAFKKHYRPRVKEALPLWSIENPCGSHEAITSLYIISFPQRVGDGTRWDKACWLQADGSVLAYFPLTYVKSSLFDRTSLKRCQNSMKSSTSLFSY